MHEPIKNFYLEGQIPDKDIIGAKTRMVEFVESTMRDDGYVPNLDLIPQFQLSYVPEKEHYDFKLTVYGTYVGKERSWQVSGTTCGKMIPMRSPKPKSTPSSPPPTLT